MNVDPVLQPHVCAVDEADAELTLQQLLNEAVPLIRQTIAACTSRTGSAVDCGDLLETVRLHLITRLRRCRANPATFGIFNWPAYVRRTTMNEYDGRFRKRFPKWQQLKMAIRYQLTRHEGFALWKNDAPGYLCGFADWRGRTDHNRDHYRLRFSGETVERLGLPPGCKTPEELRRILATLFSRANRPVPLPELVTVVAHLYGVKDPPVLTLNDETVSMAPLPARSFSSEMVVSEFLSQLWTEIVALPFQQRVALLLGARDDALLRLREAGVGSLRELARALGRTPLDVAELTKELPWSDVRIASELGLTSQDVRNRRMAARKRLFRRMRAYK